MYGVYQSDLQSYDLSRPTMTSTVKKDQEPKTCLTNMFGCVLSPNEVLESQRIPRELLILSLH